MFSIGTMVEYVKNDLLAEGSIFPENEKKARIIKGSLFSFDALIGGLFVALGISIYMAALPCNPIVAAPLYLAGASILSTDVFTLIIKIFKKCLHI